MALMIIQDFCDMAQYTVKDVSEEVVAHNLKGVYTDSSWITMRIGAITRICGGKDFQRLLKSFSARILPSGLETHIFFSFYDRCYITPKQLSQLTASSLNTLQFSSLHFTSLHCTSLQNVTNQKPSE